MFSFSSAANKPIAVELDGKRYELPRYLNYQDWADEWRRRELDTITEGMNPRQRAQFIALTPPVPLSVSTIFRAMLTPDGVNFVLESCMRKAGVPDELIQAVKESGDPRDKEELVDQLASARETVAQIDADATVDKEPDAGPGADFLPSISGSTTATSEPSPATGTVTPRDSASPTGTTQAG
jgi:hypothetical protein